MRKPLSPAPSARSTSHVGPLQAVPDSVQRLVGAGQPPSPPHAGSSLAPLSPGMPAEAPRVSAALVVTAAPERTERCQGRVCGGRGRQVRPCARRSTLRVTGTERLTADLCAQHARMAIDRPGLVRDWLHRERLEGAGRAPSVLQAGDSPGLVARATGQGHARADADLVLRVAAELASLAVVRTALSLALKRQGWADSLHPLVLLAVGEALANAIEHGSPAGGAIEVGLAVTPEWATVRVADSGRMGAAVPIRAPVPPFPTSPRGRGRLLMARLAEQVEVCSDGQGTSVVLRFAKPADVSPGGAGLN